MATFSEDEIADRLKALDGWRYSDGQITRTFSFEKFRDGIDFVVEVGEAAEADDHHPDIDIRYTDVKIAVSSHDVGGITERDFSLAQTIDALA